MLTNCDTVHSTITPRRGESLTAAIFRALDPLAGSGLSEPDRQALIVERAATDADTIAQLQRDLAAARRELAASHAAEVARLRDELAEANQYIRELQEQLAAVCHCEVH